MYEQYIKPLTSQTGKFKTSDSIEENYRVHALSRGNFAKLTYDYVQSLILDIHEMKLLFLWFTQKSCCLVGLFRKFWLLQREDDEDMVEAHSHPSAQDVLQ